MLPFLSPDGQWAAYFSGKKLFKIALEGGAPITLCNAPRPAGGTWGEDDAIVAALDGLEEGLSRVAVSGGQPQPLTRPEADSKERLMHRWPQSIGGGRAVLFAAINASLEGSLRLLDPHTGRIRTLVEHSSYGRVLASRYLVYAQGGTLFAARLELDGSQLLGPPVPLVYSVSESRDRPDFDVSGTGTLIYRHSAATLSRPYWVDSSEPLSRC